MKALIGGLDAKMRTGREVPTQRLDGPRRGASDLSSGVYRLSICAHSMRGLHADSSSAGTVPDVVAESLGHESARWVTMQALNVAPSSPTATAAAERFQVCDAPNDCEANPRLFHGRFRFTPFSSRFYFPKRPIRQRKGRIPSENVASMQGGLEPPGVPASPQASASTSSATFAV